jgi:hypothetical protein
VKHGSHTRHSAARTFASALVVCALVVAQAVVSAHYLVVPHTTCEHGDLVHGDGHHDAQAAHEHAPSIGPSEASSAVAPILELAHDHDHCVLGIESRKWTTSPDDDVVLRVAADERLPLPTAPCGPSLCSISVLALAPKASPPV